MNAHPPLPYPATGGQQRAGLRSFRRALIPLLAVGAIGGLLGWQWHLRTRPLVVEGATAQIAPLVAEWTAVGYVECRTANVTAPQVGRIARVLVREGDPVKAGQALAILESGTEQAGVAVQREGIRLATAQSAAAEAGVREAERLLRDRVARAQAEAAAAEERRKQAVAQRERNQQVVAANIAAAQATADAARAELTNLRQGGRPEEIAQAEAEVTAAEAGAVRARIEADRQERLFQQDAVPHSAVEAATEAWVRAEAALKARRAALSLLRQGARSEQIAAAQARVTAAEAQARASEGERAGLNVDERRIAEAVAARRAAEAALAEAKSGIAHLETLRHEARAAHARIGQNAASIRQAQATLAERTLVAPFAGIVGRRNVDPGDLASPSQPLFTIVESEKVWIAAEVDEQDLAPVREGQEAVITTPAATGREFVGTVARIGGEAIPQTEVRTGARIVRVRIALDRLTAAERRALKPGMEVHLTGQATLSPNAIQIPDDALMTDRDGNYVWVVEGQTARRLRVRAGYSSGRRTEILEGLKPGDPVVVSGKEKIQAGARVTLREVP